MNKKEMNNKGFSLVELIIVIAIMAILIGVLAPQFIKYVEKSRESTDITNLDTCVTAVEVYYADRTIPATGVTISVTSGVFTSSDGNAALTDAGAAATAVKSSAWTGLQATVQPTGGVTYAGSATYYTAKADGSGYDPVTTSTPAPGD